MKPAIPKPDVAIYDAAFRKASRERHYIGEPKRLALAAVVSARRKREARRVSVLLDALFEIQTDVDNGNCITAFNRAETALAAYYAREQETLKNQ